MCTLYIYNVTALQLFGYVVLVHVSAPFSNTINTLFCACKEEQLKPVFYKENCYLRVNISIVRYLSKILLL